MIVVFAESQAPWQEITGWSIPTSPSRSTRRTQMMGLLCNTVTWWASNTRTVLTAPGWLVTMEDFILVAAAATVKHHARRKTAWLDLRSSRSCHERIRFEDLKLGPKFSTKHTSINSSIVNSCTIILDLSIGKITAGEGNSHVKWTRVLVVHFQVKVKKSA